MIEGKREDALSNLWAKLDYFAIFFIAWLSFSKNIVIIFFLVFGPNLGALSNLTSLKSYFYLIVSLSFVIFVGFFFVCLFEGRYFKTNCNILKMLVSMKVFNSKVIVL